LAKRREEFKLEGGGWRSKVIVQGVEFFSQEAQQPDRGIDSGNAKYDIRFDIPFDISADVNIGKIQIMNVRKENVALFVRGELLKLEAGYEPFDKHKELVLEGTIQEIIVEELSKVTRTLTVYVGDGSELWAAAVTSKRYGAGTKASVVCRDLLDAAEIPIEMMEPAEDPTYDKGLTVCGPVRPEVEMVVRDMRSKIHISRRAAYVLAPDQGIPSDVVLSGENGLLAAKPAMSLPSDFQYGVTFNESDTPMVYEIRALLTPKLYSDVIFEVDSEDITGQWRAVLGNHRCDGQRFLTTVRSAKAS
jgi:hypothetical protein